jgi:predicted HD phosphohydrolase
MPPPIAAVLDDVIGLYTAHGRADYVGEAVSQVEHAVQCVG